jgi:hypothetical protein
MEAKGPLFRQNNREQYKLIDTNHSWEQSSFERQIQKLPSLKGS